MSDSTEKEADTFPLLPITSPQTLVKCKSLPDHPHLPTVFIASYPKSGTTWLQAIVAALLFEKIASSSPSSSFNHISDVSPFYEADRTWCEDGLCFPLAITTVHESIRCRVFNTHLWRNMLPRGDSFKYIYIVRDGKDVVLSFYHHLSHQAEGRYEKSFDNFLDEWCEGKIAFGKWILHISKWYETFIDDGIDNNRKCLLLRYENLVTSLSDEIKKIAKFLFGNTNHVDDDDNDDEKLRFLSNEKLEQLCERLSFEGMKRDLHRYQPVSVTWTDDFQFLRKGRVGDSLNTFTPEQHQKFDRMVDMAFTSDDGRVDVPDWFMELNVFKRYDEKD